MFGLILDHWPVLLCLTAVLAAIGFSLHALRAEQLPYDKRSALLTDAELAFFRVLQQAAGGDWAVFPMVRLADLIQVRPETPKPQSWLHRIHAKHIDFLLCHHQTLEAQMAVELDDKSHQQADRKLRDRFLDQALAAAHVPLLRIPVQPSYDAQKLRHTIQERLGRTGAK